MGGLREVWRRFPESDAARAGAQEQFEPGRPSGRRVHPLTCVGRLRLLAFRRKTTGRATVTDILNRNLPQLRIDHDD